MNKIRLLIADADVRFTQQAKRCLSSFADIEVIAVEQNGTDALSRVRSEHPDALLFDLVLPGLDGLSLLRAVRELADAPATICCTRLYSDVSIEAARTYGISYLMYKPVEPQALHPVLVSCTEIHKKLRRLNSAMYASAGDA